jgi:hypothetical protein
MAINPITIFLQEETSEGFFVVRWQHQLYVDPRNRNNTEKPEQIYLEYSYNSNFSGNTQKITVSYYSGQQSVRIPLGSVIYLRAVLVTSKNGNLPYDTPTVSNVLVLDARSAPTPPQNVTAILLNNNTIQIDWTLSENNGGSNIVRHHIQYSYNGGDIWFSKPVPYTSVLLRPTRYIFDNLDTNNSYIFRVLAENADGSISPTSNVTRPIVLLPDLKNILFDKTSWEHNSNIPDSLKSLLTFAAEEWEKHIKMDETIAIQINKIYDSFKGIFLSNLEIIQQPPENGSSVLAQCYVTDAVSIGEDMSPQANSISFALIINTHPDVISTTNDNTWKSVFVHELGHALGFGPFWSDYAISKLKKRPIITNHGQLAGRYQLKGTFRGNFYVKAQDEYNKLFKFQAKRKNMPLMWQNEFDEINRISHWAYERNPLSRHTLLHPPLPQDIMSYGSFAGVAISTAQITPVTIGIMLDLGYVPADNSPNTSSFILQAQTSSQVGYSTPLSPLPQNFNIGRCIDSNKQNNAKSSIRITLNESGRVSSTIVNLDEDIPVVSPTVTPTPTITPSPNAQSPSVTPTISPSPNAQSPSVTPTISPSPNAQSPSVTPTITPSPT